MAEVLAESSTVTYIDSDLMDCVGFLFIMFLLMSASSSLDFSLLCSFGLSELKFLLFCLNASERLRFSLLFIGKSKATASLTSTGGAVG